MKLHFAETMDEVLSIALEGPLPQYIEGSESQGLPAVTPTQPSQLPVQHQ